MHGRRDGVIEIEQRPGPFERDRVEQARVALQLAPSFRSECAKEMFGVYAAEPLFDVPRTALQVEWHRDGRGSTDLSRKIIAALAEPLEEHVASEREARKSERLARMLAHESLHHVLEIGRLSRMVEATRTSHLAVARPEDQCIGRPADSLRMGEESAQVVRPDGALQPVQHEKAATMGRNNITRLQAMQLELVAVIRRPTLDARLEQGGMTKQLSPEGAQMSARYPPRGGVGILAGAAHVTGNGGETRNGRPFYNIGPARMDAQIFGVKKNADTRKALRFFAERRVKTHFVDLMERAASRGELTRFAQKFGVAALVDETARRFGELGLRTARYGDDRWLEILAGEPLILKMPLVRYGNALSIGAAEATWKGWLTT